VRRTLLTITGGFAAALVAVLLLPAITPAASDWLADAPEPVRDRIMDVDGLEPGSAPADVEAPDGDLPEEFIVGADDDAGAAGDGSGADAGVPAEAIIVDAGLDFNLLGAVGWYDDAAESDDSDGGGPSSGEAQVAVRTSVDGETWSEWVSLELTAAPGDVSERRLVAEPYWVGQGRYVQFLSAGPVRDLNLAFVNSLGEITIFDRVQSAMRTVAASVAGLGRAERATALAAKPAIVTRAKWGADESLRKAPPSFAPVRMAFVHHTVNGNGYSRIDAPAVVRAIQRYHVRGAGYNDIGYNFLVDRYGTIYEGRYGGVDQGVIGAQTLGFNTGSTGVALIGTFSTATPPAAALTSLKKLLAWKLDVHHVNPAGTARMTCRADQKYKSGQTVSFAAISGHRAANYTSCPGNALQTKLPGVRTSVASMGLPKIYAPSASPELVSPDGDGSSDTTTLSFTASEALDWDIRITASDGSQLRRFNGSGKSVSRVWNGKDGSGTTIADGVYTVRITGRSARGEARPAVLEVIVDTQPPRIDDLVVSPGELERLNDGSRAKARISYSVSERVRTRVTIRDVNGTRVRTVSDWQWIEAGGRSVTWNGTVELSGAKIPAPDGPYKVAVDVRDPAAMSDTATAALRSTSDPSRWPNGATFCTRATRTFTIRRGSEALFRFQALYAPGAGETMPYAKATVVLKVRDANGRSRLTRTFSGTPLNEARSYRIARCWLERGEYRYSIYATLPDGTRQQMVGSARMTIR
jgi:flagellar hook assembly protein FlgD